MSHFKTTNRFDDMNNGNENESNPYKKQHTPKSEDRNYSENSFRSYGQRYANARRQENRHMEPQTAEEKNREVEKLKKQKEKEMEQLLQKSNFPELVSPKAEPDTHALSSDVILIADRIKKTLAEKEMHSLKKDTTPMVEAGCVSLSFNKRNIQWTYGPPKYVNDIIRSESMLDRESYYVLATLAELNETHRKEYIECWGDEEYAKMFKMPNYDYGYFDDLDEMYEEEIKAMYQEEQLYYNDENY